MIPQFKEMMFPILQFIGEHKSVNKDEIYEFIAQYFKLSNEERLLRASNGNITYIDRAAWAMSYFCGVKQVVNLSDDEKPIKKVARGIFEITQFGTQILKSSNPFGKFNDWYEAIFKNKFKNSKQNFTNHIDNTINASGRENTPYDTVLEASNELTQNLKLKILDEISQKDPSFFEYLVAKLLEKMGYGVSRLTKSGADGGIDGIVDEDELGLSKIYVQAKSWQGSVSRPEVQKFVGAISDKQTKKGVFITTSNFTKDARSYADGVQSHAVILIDGERLAELMIKYKLGVQVRQILEICDIDGDFFSY